MNCTYTPRARDVTELCKLTGKHVNYGIKHLIIDYVTE